MQFKINIKPIKLEGHTKPSPTFSLIHSPSVSVSTYGHSVITISQRGEDYIVACNYKKHRKKVQRFGKNGRKLKKPIVTPAKWVCYYYKIPVSLLKLMNKRVVQHSRHWTLEDLK